ncbi:MAG: hypothetical protein ACRDVW_04025 [Acidimicrobiales bacterium]
MSATRGSRRARSAGTVLAVLLARPSLWPVSLATLARLAPVGWWRRPPFLPVPDNAYWRFRMHTAYGEDWTTRPTKRDVVDYLEWCQRARSPRR